MAENVARARAFLDGEQLAFGEANRIWEELKKSDELSLARAVISRVRENNGVHLLDSLPATREVREKLCQQEAMLTSKDPELGAAIRHDRALRILADLFNLDDPALDGDSETLGIAGGIYKRRWADLGQLADLQRAALLYRRGAGDDLGEDAYAHVNAAFLEDLLAETGCQSEHHRGRAADLRRRIVNELPKSGSWWNSASRAEALFGLGRYQEAREALLSAAGKRAPWKLETTARQLGTLAHLREKQPFERREITEFFKELLPGQGHAIRSALAGKVGLALSGGGFRASYYHLGVLARLAEQDVLRHVDVLSCVSGGSIVGTCYWLALRQRLLDSAALDYVSLVRELIDHFDTAVQTNIRRQAQPSRLQTLVRFASGWRGAIDPEVAAVALDKHFYRPLMPDRDNGPVYMHELPFTPADHDPNLVGPGKFNPSKHNWLRAHKVPALVINATTVNTGHAWQFTPTWMGESPWAVHAAADNVPRLHWSDYEPDRGWSISLGRAVAASACVPGVFAPLALATAYPDVQVHLVDGGVYDNQGSAALLAHGCNVLLVSDAAGQLLFENRPGAGLSGLVGYAKRSMDTLMERIRQANYGDLEARLRSSLLRGLMFVHMKSGLDADPIRLPFSHDAYSIQRAPLSPSGVRKDFQQALAELRTDLDAFSLDESRALMACGYQMAAKAVKSDLADLSEIWREGAEAPWPFADLLSEITSTAATTPRRGEILEALKEGRNVRL